MSTTRRTFLLAALAAGGVSDQTSRADWDGDGKPDFVFVQNGPRMREVHATTGKSGFQDYCTHAETGLQTTGAEWTTLFGDWDGDRKPDMFAFRTAGTASGNVEVHIYSHKSGFRDAVVQKVTGLKCFAPADGQLLLTSIDNDHLPDMVFVNRAGKTATEVFFFSGRTDFHDAVLTIPTGLPPTGPNWTFDFADMDADGTPDFVAFGMSGTASGKMEMHVFSAKSAFLTAIRRHATPLNPCAPADGKLCLANFADKPTPDLVWMPYKGASGRTEIHVLSSDSNFSEYIVHAATPVHYQPGHEVFVSNSLWKAIAIGLITSVAGNHIDRAIHAPAPQNCPQNGPSPSPSPSTSPGCPSGQSGSGGQCKPGASPGPGKK